MTNPQYLVRPHDSHIFELDESNQCYRSFSAPVEYPDGTRPNAQSHFTLDNLTSNYDFFQIKKSELKKYEEKHNFHLGYVLWSTRPDGHGGIKGGTM